MLKPATGPLRRFAPGALQHITKDEMVRQDPRTSSLVDRAAQRFETLENPDGVPMWPDRYLGDDPVSAFRFLTECWWTYNEADQEIQLVPTKQFVEDTCYVWVTAFVKRQPMVYEKSRRMIVSWMCRGLETWQMGKKRGSWIIIDQTHKNAAEHLWRVWFALDQLKDRRPEFDVSMETRGSLIVKEPTHVILKNGSIFTQGHQEAGTTQGKGMTGITLEELSKYDHAAEFWGQAQILTQGKAKGGGGWVCAVANASANEDWHKIKGGLRAREFLGVLDSDWL